MSSNRSKVISSAAALAISSCSAELEETPIKDQSVTQIVLGGDRCDVTRLLTEVMDDVRKNLDEPEFIEDSFGRAMINTKSGQIHFTEEEETMMQSGKGVVIEAALNTYNVSCAGSTGLNDRSCHITGTLPEIEIQALWIGFGAPSEKDCVEASLNFELINRFSPEGAGLYTNTQIKDCEGQRELKSEEVHFKSFNLAKGTSHREFFDQAEKTDRPPKYSDDHSGWDDWYKKTHDAYMDYRYGNGYEAPPVALSWDINDPACAPEREAFSVSYDALRKRAKDLLRQKEIEEIAEHQMSECAQEFPDQEKLKERVSTNLASVVMVGGGTGFRFGPPEAGLVVTAGHCLIEENLHECRHSSSCTTKDSISVRQPVRVESGKILEIEETRGIPIYFDQELDLGLVLLDPDATEIPSLVADTNYWPDFPKGISLLSPVFESCRPIGTDLFTIGHPKQDNGVKYKWTVDVVKLGSHELDFDTADSQPYTHLGIGFANPPNCHLNGGSSGSPIMGMDGKVLAVLVSGYASLSESTSGYGGFVGADIEDVVIAATKLQMEEPFVQRRARLFEKD